MVLGLCRKAFPDRLFELKVIKTTGDKLQTASMSKPDASLPKGLFTKELEVALLEKEADLAVHSLKDLPTELPEGLILGAVLRRADVRDVMIYRSKALVEKQAQTKSDDWTPGQAVMRGFKAHLRVRGLPQGATVATSSTRRKAQLLALRPDLRIVEIRGNVGTRLQKLADQAEIDATILAAAGLDRLGFYVFSDGSLRGKDIPQGLLATHLEADEMLPCVGQGAIGIETRAKDEVTAEICAALNHVPTWQSVTTERAFLRGMGGGCQSPVGAHAELLGHQLRLRAVSFVKGTAERTEKFRPAREAELLGKEVAEVLK